MDRNVANMLKQLADIIIEETEKNDDFACKIGQILRGEMVTVKKKSTRCKISGTERPSNRRDPAVIDPVSLILKDEFLLVEKLQNLTDKQLKDIIADYGMDPSKLAMKWRNRERLINYIVDTARRRAVKGDAFREKAGDDADN